VRDGAEYEFGIVFSVNQAHRAEATKDRTALFTEQMIDLCDPEVHASLVGWMNAGGPETPKANHATPATAQQLARLRVLADHEAITDEGTAAITAALAAPMSEAKAAKWITQLEAKIAESTNGAGAV
jgi:hypothetical protein